MVVVGTADLNRHDTTRILQMLINRMVDKIPDGYDISVTNVDFDGHHVEIKLGAHGEGTIAVVSIIWHRRMVEWDTIMRFRGRLIDVGGWREFDTLEEWIATMVAAHRIGVGNGA